MPQVENSPPLPRISQAQARRLTRRAPWPVRLLTLLLLLQAFIYVTLPVLAIDWSLLPLVLWLTYVSEIAMLALGVLGLIAAIGFALLRPPAWLEAMLVQGLFLLLGLVVYARYRPENTGLYLLMLFSIVLVLYLNLGDVRQVFRNPAGAGREGQS